VRAWRARDGARARGGHAKNSRLPAAGAGGGRAETDEAAVGVEGEARQHRHVEGRENHCCRSVGLYFRPNVTQQATRPVPWYQKWYKVNWRINSYRCFCLKFVV